MKINMFGFIALLVLYVPMQSMENESFIKDIESVIDTAFQTHNPQLVAKLFEQYKEVQLSDNDYTELKLYISHVFKDHHLKTMQNWQEISEIIFAKKNGAILSDRSDIANPHEQA